MRFLSDDSDDFSETFDSKINNNKDNHNKENQDEDNHNEDNHNEGAHKKKTKTKTVMTKKSTGKRQQKDNHSTDKQKWFSVIFAIVVKFKRFSGLPYAEFVLVLTAKYFITLPVLFCDDKYDNIILIITK